MPTPVCDTTPWPSADTFTRQTATLPCTSNCFPLRIMDSRQASSFLARTGASPTQAPCHAEFREKSRLTNGRNHMSIAIAIDKVTEVLLATDGTPSTTTRRPGLLRIPLRQTAIRSGGCEPKARDPVRAGCLALVGAGTRLRLPLIDSCIAVHELNASIAQAGRNVLHAHELISCRSLGRQGVRRPYVFHGAGRLIGAFAPADFPVVGHGGNCSIQTCAPYAGSNNVMVLDGDDRPHVHRTAMHSDV